MDVYKVSRRCPVTNTTFLAVTDLILVVVKLLKRDINELVKIVREALEPIELWDKG